MSHVFDIKINAYLFKFSLETWKIIKKNIIHPNDQIEPHLTHLQFFVFVFLL